jgi:hypothetical protein
MIKLLLAFISGVALGVLSGRAGVPDKLLKLTAIRPLGRKVILNTPTDSGLTANDWRRSYARHGHITLVAFGQSQAANFGEPDALATDSVWALYNGRVHRSGGVMPGVEGTGMSVWPRLATRLEHYFGKPVVVLPIAVGATLAEDWLPSAYLGRRLREIIESAVHSDMEPSAALLMLGEADAAKGTSHHVFARHLREVAEQIGRIGRGPVLVVARETRCYDVPATDAIRNAQRFIVNNTSVLAGPDLDQLGPGFRWDGCHFNSMGLDSVSSLWMRTLLTLGDSVWLRGRIADEQSDEIDSKSQRAIARGLQLTPKLAFSAKFRSEEDVR